MNNPTHVMTNNPLRPTGESVSARRFLHACTRGALLSACLLLGACASTPQAMPFAQTAREPASQSLHAGDVIKVTFPRAATLDTTQQIRRDGKINLSIVGEVTVEGLTPVALEQKLVELYSTELTSKEIRVTVVSSAFSIFVTGAVIHPGKLTPERTLTAFEAIMEAGGFDLARANTKTVTIIRQEAGQTKNFTVNLKAVLDGKETQPFYLQAHDVIFVPEKFSWF